MRVLTQLDLTKVFIKNFVYKPRNQILRKIGLELELPAVKHSGEAVDYKTIRKMFQWLSKKGWSLRYDEGTGETVAAERTSQSKGRFGYINDCIGTDVGYCTVETALTPEDNLFDLERHWTEIKKVLLEFFKSENCYLLGYGVQPITPPQKSLLANRGRYKFFEQDALNRFIDQKYGNDLHVFATSAANQCHVDVYRSEAITAVNTFNRLAPLFTALTANAPVWKGEIDPVWKDIREIFWDKSWTNRIDQVGIPNEFSHFRGYIDTLCQFRPLMVKRQGQCLKILNCQTFAEYIKQGANNWGEAVSGHRVKLHAQPEDICFHSGFAWWQSRLSPLHGTLEVRPCGQQPQNSTLSVAALSLGLLENLDKAKKLAYTFSIKEWRKLRFDTLRHGFAATVNQKSTIPYIKKLLKISKRGLEKRDLGEEQYLQPLFNRVAKKSSPADKVIKVFNPSNPERFLNLVKLS